MHDADMVWLGLLEELLSAPVVHPRGLATREWLGKQTTIDMKYPIITVNERRLGYKFMFAEAAWILAGDYRVSTISPFNSNISKFSDDGYTFFGAYGPKFAMQLPYVIQNLNRDRQSRQAVINIWRESPAHSKDYPCTLSLQWIIRENELHCMATMRSSDAWLGVPYDWFNFSMMSAYVAMHLRRVNPREFGNLDLGQLRLTAGSQHLYENNWEGARRMVEDAVSAKELPPLNIADFDRFPNPDVFIHHLNDVALRGSDRDDGIRDFYSTWPGNLI